MAKVTNLSINQQSGGDVFYASWDFNEETKSTSGDVKKNDLVTISSDAVWYSGAHIPDWVRPLRWRVVQVKGDRAVLGKSENGRHNIQSPINVKFLSGGTGADTVASTKTLEHYEVKWYYDTGDGVWFAGGSSNVDEKNATYNPPENAIRVKVSVKPVSQTYRVNNKETSYWTGTAVTVEYSISASRPKTPSIPSVEIDKYVLKATLENIDDGTDILTDSLTDEIVFEVYNGNTKVNTGTATVLTRQASFSCTVAAGGEYRVRCRAVNINSTTKIYSDWTDYTSPQSAIPAAPSGITECKALSETSVYLEWPAADAATSYDVEYAEKLEYFDGSNATSTETGIEFNHYTFTGLETGLEYFFRVRGVNEQGHSAWSDIKSIVIGKRPSSPTTWSSTTTVISGEPLNLYWVHNAEDGSSQTYAELQLYINESETPISITIRNSADEETKDKTSVCTIDTVTGCARWMEDGVAKELFIDDSLIEGSKIEWCVKTAGITGQFSDWSIRRTVNIYARPSLDLRITDADKNSLDVITSFPFYISAIPGPPTSKQTPIGYHLTITSNATYEATDSIGNARFVNVGEQVYSRYFDTTVDLLVELLASSIDLQNGVSYTARCIVSMDSGLTAESVTEFEVSWTDVEYEPDAGIAIDPDTFTAYIRPYCRDSDGNLVEDVALSVYRREFDGRFTEIAAGLDNGQNTVVTDPHPALDYARYRIVAIDNSTGAVSFYDAPGYPVGGTAVIIQWDEAWSNFDASNSDELEQSPWAGSFLRLPYNVDVSDNNKPDVALVEYIGRAHPISYYGTQLGSSSSWSVVVPKDDEETLYALRRLAVWMGDVYVREPSGSGYWATITVSFSQKHCDQTVPVTLDITRVEGGI